MSAPMGAVVEALQRRGSRRVGDNWTCPAHEDSNPSLSVSEGDGGRVLLHCHAGCAPEAIVEALGQTMADLFPDAGPIGRRNGNGKPESHGPGTSYDYPDETGKVLFRVVRGPVREGNKKTFGQNPPDGNGGWIKGKGAMDGIRRVLFRLPELLASDPTQTVYLAEGEKDALNLAAAGAVATTNPGGAGKWRVCEKHGQGRFSEPLRDRAIVILPDNDEAGRRHAADVAERLRVVAASVKIMALPGLPAKGDVSDWLRNGGTAEALTALAAAAPVWGPKDSGENVGGGAPANSQAKLLVEIAIESGLELFHDQRDEPFAAIPDERGRRVVSVASKDFGLWLRRLVWAKLGSAPSGEVITTARHTLASIARFDGPRHELHVRIAWHEGAIWVDLDGRAAVRITPGRWEVVEHPPILFRCFGHQKPFPRPCRGGKVDDCLRYLRIADPKTRLLFVCYLAAAMIPGIPVAAVIVHGVQGATKTTLLKIVKRLLDPSAIEVRGGVRDLTEFAQAAAQNRVLFFDNLSTVPDWLSDALCRAVTGEGWSKRSLYTDEDSTVFEYRGVVGLAGINVVANRADLLDRSIIIPMEPVPQGERQAERQFWEEFEAARPAILGGIFDVLAKAMAIEPTLVLPRLPRMADFARWGAAASSAMGRRPEEFLDAYRENTGRQNDAAVEASPIAQTVLSLMESRIEWEGSPSDLLTALDEEAGRLRINTKDREWPKAPNWVARRIRQVQPNLLSMGVEFHDQRSNDQRSILLRKSEFAAASAGDDALVAVGLAGDSMTASRNAVTDAVTGNSLGGNGSPEGDSSDSISASFRCQEEENDSDGWLDEYEERAAIAEFDGGAERSEAELRARAMCLVDHEAGREGAEDV